MYKIDRWRTANQSFVVTRARLQHIGNALINTPTLNILFLNVRQWWAWLHIGLQSVNWCGMPGDVFTTATLVCLCSFNHDTWSSVFFRFSVWQHEHMDIVNLEIMYHIDVVCVVIFPNCFPPLWLLYLKNNLIWIYFLKLFFKNRWKVNY